jgi:hypothetical protein
MAVRVARITGVAEAMVTPHDLERALDTPGGYRLGGPNIRPVRCARCHAGCLGGQARRVHIRAWDWRSVYLCVAVCAPKGGT